ncbi:MAG: hypothetical protein AMJ84_02935 [Acidithiobacillales bacterium SM23_46]|nr:MAG: hypothetical protein AMJ84_02935 [Acidithiobacillales bacterium SM23_46]
MNEFAYDDLIGKPFAEDGNGPDSYNCWNLCREVCRRAGLNLPARSYIYDEQARDAAIQAGKAEFVQLTHAEPFCIVVFQRRRWAHHLGIVLPNCTEFMHVTRTRPVTVERLDKHARKIEGFYRYAGAD